HCHVEATEHIQMGMVGSLYIHPKQDGTPFTYNSKTYTKFAYNDGDGSTGYDKEYPIQLGSLDSNFHDQHIAIQPLPFAAMSDNYPLLNGRGYPDTINPGVIETDGGFGALPSQKQNAKITATAGERVLLRLSNLGVMRFYTLGSTIPMTVVGHNAKQLRGPTGTNLYYDTNSVTLGGGESIDVILNTAGIAPGTYFLYTTNLNFLSNDGEDFGGMMTEITIQ
ncbi:MAG: multicopper oxidase family protein, partial [Vicinamibacterales bacterium]